MAPQSYSTRRSQWPFVGRLGEVDRLSKIFDEINRGGLIAGVVIAGEAGVGKSALAQQFVDHLGSRWEVRRFTASPASQTIAFSVFGRNNIELGHDPFTQAERLVDRLAVGAPGKRVVLYVDDVHYLDDSSAFVLQQLAARGVALLLTYREGSPCPDSVAQLWRGRTVDRLDLEPMQPKDAGDLLETLLEGLVETATTRRLWDITQGNALYLREVIEGERAAGRLRRENGVWMWSGAPTLTPNLRDLISARMGAVAEPQLTVIDALAVSEPLPVSVLADLSSPEAVEAAEAQKLISVTTGDGELQAILAHPLFGEARREQAGTVRLRRIRGSLMTALEAYSSDPRVLLRVAALSLDADVPLDPELLVSGAHAALAQFDFPLANRLADAANSVSAATAVRLSHAGILVTLFRGAEADAVLSSLDLAPDDELYPHVIALRAINLTGGLGQVELADQVLNEAIAVLGSAPPAIAGAKAGILAARGELERALSDATTAQESPIPPYIDMMIAASRVLSAGVLGRIEDMEAAADYAFSLAASEPEASQLRFYVASLVITGYLGAGFTDRLDATASRLDDEASLVPPGVADAPATVLLGMQAFSHGQTGAAIQRLNEALVQPTTRGMAPRALVCLSQAHAIRGEAAAARQFWQMLKMVMPVQLKFMHGPLGVAEVWVLAAEGSVAEAITRAHEVARGAAAIGDQLSEILVLQLASQLGDATAVARLEELAASAEGPRAGVVAAHARALAAKSPQALEDASDSYAKLGDGIGAIDAAAQAALLYERAGDRTKANKLSAHAQRIASECGARTPALQQVQMPDLSAREREVATLVADGLTTKDIATRLGLSARTVEGHVSRALQKTGSATRLELTALFRRV